MKKTCLIRCPAGLGDILFVQKIGRKLIDKGYEVYWPVVRPFEYIKKYISGFNWITLSSDHPDAPLDRADEIPLSHLWERDGVIAEQDNLFVNLHHPDKLWPYDPIMATKYKLVDLSFSNWSQYVDINRDHKKEEELFYNVLNLKDGDKYCLTNTFYGSPPWSKPIDTITTTGKYKIVQMEHIDNFTPFDWWKVLINACEIHTVETCYLFLLEMLTMTTSDINIYSRKPKPEAPSWLNSYFIFNKPFKWIHI